MYCASFLLGDGMKIDINKMMKDIGDLGYIVKAIVIEKETLDFEERVKMNCFYCGKYNSNWKCPPKIPMIDYRKMLNEFENAAFIYTESRMDTADFNTIRNNSSVYLHRAMLECEKWLYEHNHSMALSFIGGSCKLCKNGCAPGQCANPYQARTPIEALGINVVKSAGKYGIEIKFPPEEKLIRIGLLLW